MRKFFDADLPLKEIFIFIDKMFDEYPKRRRLKPIDLNWLHGVTAVYLKTGSKMDETPLKAKAPKVELDAEMQAWLKKEKERWLKKDDSAA